MFSLVMKTYNGLRLRVLTWNTSSPGIRVFTWHTCPLLAYVSSPGIRVFNLRMCPQLAYVSSPGEHVFTSNRRACLSTSPSPSWVCAQKIMHLPSRVKSLDGDHGMDRCHYAVPFKGISLRSTPEIVLLTKTRRER